MSWVNTRSDICFVLNSLSRCMVELRHSLGSCKTCAILLEGCTILFGMGYVGDGELILHGFVADLAWGVSNKKIASVHCFSWIQE